MANALPDWYTQYLLARKTGYKPFSDNIAGCTYLANAFALSSPILLVPPDGFNAIPPPSLYALRTVTSSSIHESLYGK